MNSSDKTSFWSSRNAADLYGIDEWSNGYFGVSPEGEVSLAPDLSVTFSQPMVAVTSQEAAAQYAPVELTPQVEGRWRWLGTKTLMFDTDKRFPMATKFTARVPAGTKAINGQILAKDVSWTFTTPPPKVEQMIPQNQITRRDALIFISFDQQINPEAVLKTTSVTSGGRRIATRRCARTTATRSASSSPCRRFRITTATSSSRKARRSSSAKRSPMPIAISCISRKWRWKANNS